MTGKTGGMDRQGLDIDEGAGDEPELSTGQQLLDAALLVASQLKRTVVFVPIFGVVYLAMGFLWYQDAQLERALQAKSDAELVLLSQPAPQPDLLLKQAGGWATAYRVTLGRRISRQADSDLIGRVIDAAQSAGLAVIETGTNRDGIATLENDRYTVTPLLMRANGTLDGIERFLYALETDEFAAFEVQSSMFNAEVVGYILTLRGVFYSLPENYGEVLADEDPDAPVIPVVPVVRTAAGGVLP